MKKFLPIFLFLTGCAGIQQRVSTPPDPSECIVNASFDNVWGAIMERATERSWSIKTVDKASGLIVTDFLKIGRNVIVVTDSSDSPIAVVEDGRETLNLFASKVDEKRTRVKITVHYEAFVHSLAGYEWVPLVSRGHEEKSILDDITTRLHAQSEFPQTK